MYPILRHLNAFMYITQYMTRSNGNVRRPKTVGTYDTGSLIFKLLLGMKPPSLPCPT